MEAVYCNPPPGWLNAGNIFGTDMTGEWSSLGQHAQRDERGFGRNFVVDVRTQHGLEVPRSAMPGTAFVEFRQQFLQSFRLGQKLGGPERSLRIQSADQQQ